ncbi:MAG: hypothetical protein ACOCV2_11475 [Persicimonas sp.]
MLEKDDNAEPTSWGHFWLVYGAAVVLLSLGCVSSDMKVGEIGVCGDGATQWTEQRGENGSLGFHHIDYGTEISSEPRYFSFNPLVLEGFYQVYYVSYWSDGSDALIDYVETSDSSVLEVTDVGDDWFEVYAHYPDYAEITVETEDGYRDRIELEATRLDRVEFSHCCTDGGRATYLTDSEVSIPVTYRDEYDDAALGYGEFPFEISDEGNLTVIDTDDPSAVHLETGSRPDTVDLMPTVGGSNLTLDLIDHSDVDGLSVDFVRDDVSSGVWFVGGVPYHDSEPICAGRYPMSLETLTPENCELVDDNNNLTTQVDINADEYAMLESYTTSDKCRIRAELFDDRGSSVVTNRVSERLD